MVRSIWLLTRRPRSLRPTLTINKKRLKRYTVSKVLLIDGMNMIHRSNIIFGSPQEGLSYTLVYNLFRGLKAATEFFKPDKIWFCLEGKSNFRYKLLPSYKANRIIKTASESKTESFSRQRDIAINLLSYLPVTQIKSEGFEADDVISTLAENLKDEDITILSSDSDFIQLLQKGYPSLTLYNPATKQEIFPPAHLYLVWKCLFGDKSDNIPGLVGEREALSLVESPELLKEFLSAEENRANFSLNKSLIELKVVPEEELLIQDGEWNPEKLMEHFTEMGFTSMLATKYWSSFKETFSLL